MRKVENTIRLDPEIKEKLYALAIENRLSLSQMVSRLIEQAPAPKEAA